MKENEIDIMQQIADYEQVGIITTYYWYCHHVLLVLLPYTIGVITIFIYYNILLVILPYAVGIITIHHYIISIITTCVNNYRMKFTKQIS